MNISIGRGEADLDFLQEHFTCVPPPIAEPPFIAEMPVNFFIPCSDEGHNVILQMYSRRSISRQYDQ